MARRIKTGRRATTDDRARAAGLIKKYRLAQASPNGQYCVNPEDEPEFQIFIYADDPEPLLEALQNFAEHGTFELMSDIEPFVMRLDMSELRNSGMSYEEAIVTLAEKYHISESTVSRCVRRTVKT